VKAVDPLGHLPLSRVELEMVGDVNAAYDEDVIICFDLAPGFGAEITFTGRDVARFQRASKGPGQSTSCRCDQVIEGSGMGVILAHVSAVMPGDAGVDAEGYRLVLDRQIGPTVGPLNALDAHVGYVNDFIAHTVSSWLFMWTDVSNYRRLLEGLSYV
jgi:hypothetical protein